MTCVCVYQIFVRSFVPVFTPRKFFALATRSDAASSTPDAMDALLLRLLGDEATEDELRRVDQQPHLLLHSLTRWVDEQLLACLTDTAGAVSGEAVASRRAAAPSTHLRTVASPTIVPPAPAPAAVPAASEFPPLGAAMPLGAALAAPRRIAPKQRRRMAPTQVTIPASTQASVPSPAPFGQSADAAADAAPEPFQRQAQPVAALAALAAPAEQPAVQTPEPVALATPDARIPSGDTPGARLPGRAAAVHQPAVLVGLGLEARLP